MEAFQTMFHRCWPLEVAPCQDSTDGVHSCTGITVPLRFTPKGAPKENINDPATHTRASIRVVHPSLCDNGGEPKCKSPILPTGDNPRLKLFINSSTSASGSKNTHDSSFVSDGRQGTPWFSMVWWEHRLCCLPRQGDHYSDHKTRTRTLTEPSKMFVSRQSFPLPVLSLREAVWGPEEKETKVRMSFSNSVGH